MPSIGGWSAQYWRIECPVLEEGVKEKFIARILRRGRAVSAKRMLGVDNVRGCFSWDPFSPPGVGVLKHSG